MRTLSTALRKVYEAEGGYAVPSRARLSNDGGSTWTDLRALKGRDFYLGASWTESVDQGITELHLLLRREVDSWSLSPNMEENPINNPGGSFEPLLQKAHTRVQVQVAIRPLQSTAPGSSDWITVFSGLLVSFSTGSSDGVIDCYCRDLGDLLMHTNFIEEEREYGTDGGRALEYVLNDIISESNNFYPRWKAATAYTVGDVVQPTADGSTWHIYEATAVAGNSGGTEPTWPISSGGTVVDGGVTWTEIGYVDSLVSVPTSPGWDLGRYKQRCEPIFTACETLAMQIGWRVSYHWDSSDNYFFTLWAPDRDATSPVYVLKEYQRRAVPSFGAETDYIRNAVEIPYFDKADLDSSGQPKLKRVLVDKDYTGDAGVAALAAASEAAHGRRFMRYAPAAGANIDTQSEAERLGESAVKDLADAMVDMEVECPFLHFLQLGDLITVPADNVNHDTDLNVAVTVIKQALVADGRASTTLGLRGRPQGARVQWMYRMAHPAVTRPLTLTGPDAVENLTVQETTEGMVVWFDEPLRGVKPFEYELHLSTSSSFTPSSSTLFATSRTNNFTVTGYEPGTTYYAKVVPRSAPLEANRAGIPGTASSEETVVPRYVEPRRLQPDITYAVLPLNGSFEAWNNPAAPPDAWTMVVGTWGTDAEVTSISATGSRAIDLPTSTLAELRGQWFTIAADEQISMLAYYRAADTPFLTEIGDVGIIWKDGLGIETRETLAHLGGMAGGLGGFARVYGFSVAPTSTKLGRFFIRKTRAAAEEMLVDSIRLTILTATPEATHSLLNSFTGATSPRQTLKSYRGPDGRVHVTGTVTRATSPSSGTKIASMTPPPATISIPVATDTGYGEVELQDDGDLVYISGGFSRIDINFSYLPA